MSPTTKISITICIASVLFCIRCSKASNNQDSSLPSADQYITWNISGQTGSVTSPLDSIASARYSSDTHLVGLSTGNQNSVYLIFTGDRQPGTYNVTFSDIFINQKTYLDMTHSLRTNVSKYGNIGDYITGSYSGNVIDSASSNTFLIEGNFKIKTR